LVQAITNPGDVAVRARPSISLYTLTPFIILGGNVHKIELELMKDYEPIYREFFEKPQKSL